MVVVPVSVTAVLLAATAAVVVICIRLRRAKSYGSLASNTAASKDGLPRPGKQTKGKKEGEVVPQRLPPRSAAPLDVAATPTTKEQLAYVL